MIFDISDDGFKELFGEEQFFLPIRWDGVDFSDTLRKLYTNYLIQIEQYLPKSHSQKNYDPDNAVLYRRIKQVCGLLSKSVSYYLNGFPSRAFNSLNRAMRILMEQPLKVYTKSVLEQFEQSNNRIHRDCLQLFRVARVYDNRPYPRSRIFHTPYSLRSRVSTNRYSIAGHPSLYLGTSLELCCNELKIVPSDLAIAARFQLERELEYSNTVIRVIELGIKPQDFLFEEQNDNAQRTIPRYLLQNKSIRTAYLLWYPLIAACSYIRVNKDDPFAAEYIIPQLLMQWVRMEGESNHSSEYDQLIGIRYFSCASVKSSDMGFNYVFPTSGQQISPNLPFCSVLARSFRLTKPVFIHEYPSVYKCEYSLHSDTNLCSVDV